MRLGGIYALERVARDSPQDQNVVIEILTAHVREHAPSGQPLAANPPPANIDARTVVKVLGRRRRHQEEDAADLSSTNLPHPGRRAASA